ncbi:exodeoxyribonuclease V beta subunit [Pseudoalteromonas ulvae UL12]|uniref:exodeoxyribonuclease V subunit beta n=1 Tax=Pseudoalteromonas ulvae TaxID=107327 RepID=UPI00186B7BB9|nr:exodeoxyribonuclease V subunit beta [Pseudoalteromonas ulvae]MBE0363282.1 exodeoxyribonuclease V beta subunit [Pseudoalteromonas ulvae UL12]
MQVLNPVTMPLTGASLIEASAGTGKTYTITALYIRQLLGLQTSEPNNEPLSVEQILVVTFTEAATAEIRDRVRTRIIDARDALMGAPCHDPLLAEILTQISDPKWAYSLLDAAAKSMDDAAIFTIHGFCQRMLKQHAFESGVAFNLNFILDQSELLLEALKDYWRVFVYQLDKQKTQTVLNLYPAPQSLYKKVFSLLARQTATVIPQYNLAQMWQLQDDYHSALKHFKQEYLVSDFAAKIAKSDIKKNKAAAKAANLDALVAFCQSDEQDFSFGSAKNSFETWSQAAFDQDDMYKKNGQRFSHPLCAQFSQLSHLRQAIKEGLPLAIAQDAALWVKQALITKKQDLSLISPDDLLTYLYQALMSEGGEALATQIAQCYPVAMIDEFQDTDPIQYGIFSRIFLNQAASLIMIGDPKQAIYGFRGADIFTYIDAKQGVDTQQQYTLAKNWRSSQGIVNGVNALFSHHDNSFIFNQAIPFLTVQAHGKSPEQALVIDKQPVKALAFCVLEHDKPLTNKAYAMPLLATQFSQKIAELLLKAQQGEALIAGQPVEAADICVLVRDRIEASAMKTALTQAGIASVYLARDGIFSTALATHILNFLTALHGQYDEAAYRGVLAGPLFNLSYQQIFQLNEDEQAWQHYLSLFAELSDIWHKKGAMAMMERLLMRNNLAGLWQSIDLPVERWLTDFRHLSEILQQKQLELEGSLRLVRWLAQSIVDNDGDSTQLRLESDAKLVKIVTMHASKGLEYPIVFMPFAVGFREASEQIYHQDNQLIYNLIKDDESQALSEKERLAEDLRLLYVALTRPVHQCYIGMYNLAVGNTKRMMIQRSALGHLLFAGKELTSAEDWHALLNAFVAEHSDDMTVHYFSDVTETTQLSQHAQHTLYQCKEFKGRIERDWRLTSFSALTHNQASEHITPGFEDESHELDWQGEEEQLQLNEFSFPKGAKPGSCLHAIFEEIDFQHPHQHPSDATKNLEHVVETQLARYGIDEKWQPTAIKWVESILSCPLNEQGLSLSQLPMSQCLIEMEFYLPISGLSPVQINQILDLVTDDSAIRNNLRFETISGLLKGFIDLIFVWQDQYYVLDYKSNHLGDQGSDYNLENMEQVMQSHHYHLQYLLYSVALHRLLKQRIKGYQIERDLGGVYYLFLRGLPTQQGIYFKQVDTEVILKLDAIFDSQRHQEVVAHV